MGIYPQVDNNLPQFMPDRIVDSDGVITYSFYDDAPIYSTSNSNLGTTAKSVAPVPKTVARRADKYRLLAEAARLLPTTRTAKCMRCLTGGAVGVMFSPSKGVAAFAGLQTCGSVWTCAVCSAKVSKSRQDEMNMLLSWSRKMGYKPFLLTLTARHRVGDSLENMLNSLKLAKRKLHQSKEWKAIKPFVIGHVTATEVTFGANGWHPHFHTLIIFDVAHRSQAQDLLDHCQEKWLHVLEHNDVGLSGNIHAWQTQGADAVQDYITKWGAAEELSLGQEKGGKAAGRSPWQLLSDSEKGDLEAGLLWLEYAKCFTGKRQLVWSRYLKDLVGIIERSDAELVEDPEEDDMQQVATIEYYLWRQIVNRGLRAELLHVVEQGGWYYLDYWLHALETQIERGL